MKLCSCGDCFSCDLSTKLDRAMTKPAASDDKVLFVSTFNSVAHDVHVNAIKKGWWEGSRNDAEVIALMHSELSEALESMRNGDPKSEKIPNFKGSEEELADVIIRIMDYSAGNNLDVAGAICEKIKYNEGRSYRHGGKKF